MRFLLPWLVIFVPLMTNLCRVGAQSDDRRAPERFKTFTLPMPRQPGRDETLRVVVTVGELARGDTLIVRTKAGQIVGSIVTTGLRPGQKGGIFSLPVPRQAVTDSQVVLRMEVVPSISSQKSRAPTSSEVEKVALELIPITVP